MNDDFAHESGFADVPFGLAEILERELEPKERVVWLGQPDVVRYMKRHIAIFLFGVPFFAFTVFWTVKATSGIPRQGDPGKTNSSGFFLLWGAMFMVIGACMLLSPLWAWWVARRTLYVVTDRRALLIEAPGRCRVQSFAGERLLNTVRVEDRSGSGDLILERLPIRGAKGRTTTQEIGFFGLDDVKHVEQLVRATVGRGGENGGHLCDFLQND